MVIKGNAVAEGKDRRGWFIGSFIDPKQELKSNSEVEIKWGVHPKGEERSSKASEDDFLTVSLLIKGKFLIKFEDREELLQHEGDYIIWKPNTFHSTVTLEDAVIITIRLPSLSSQQN